MRFSFGTALVAATIALVAVPGAAAGDTPLIDAIKNQDRQAVRSLLKQKALATQPSADGTTPLHWAVRVDDLELVRALLQAGAKDVANRYGTTPLELAA